MQCQSFELSKDGNVYELCGGVRKLSTLKAADVRKSFSSGFQATAIEAPTTVQKSACSCSTSKAAEQPQPCKYGNTSEDVKKLHEAEKNFSSQEHATSQPIRRR